MEIYFPNNHKAMKSSILLLFFVFASQNFISSQISVNSYTELGDNNVSYGAYGNFSTQVSARFGSFSASTGGLLSFSNATDNVLSAYSLQLANDFQIFKQPVNIAAFYLWKPFSPYLRETNFGLLADFRTIHFGYMLGLNSRLYSYTAAAKRKYNIPDSISTSIWEPINLMYRLTFYQQISPKWNFEASVTNFDTYIIEQETNPMIIAKFTYKLNPKLKFYGDLGYMQAGLLNIRVNYFGVFCRGGVIWDIN